MFVTKENLQLQYCKVNFVLGGFIGFCCTVNGLNLATSIIIDYFNIGLEENYKSSLI